MANRKRKIFRIRYLIVALAIIILYRIGGNLLIPVARNQIKQMTGAQVDINDVSFRLNGRITFRNIRIGPSEHIEPDNAILEAKSLDAYFSPLSFLKLSPKLDKLRISDFVVNIQFNGDKKVWNILALKLPEKKKGGIIPELIFRRGEIKFAQILKGQESKLVSAYLKLSTAKTITYDGQTTFTFTEDSPASGESDQILVKIAKKENVEISIQTRLPHLDFRLFGSKCNINSFDSTITADGNSVVFHPSRFAIGPETIIDVNGNIYDCKIDPAFKFHVKTRDLTIRQDPSDNCFAFGSRIFESFIPLLQVFFDNFSPQGKLGLEVDLTGKAKQIAKTHCLGRLDCNDIAMQFYLFPYILEHLRGRIDVTETSMKLRDVKASHGKVDITMKGYCNGFGEAMDSNVVLHSDNMVLDDDLYEALLPNHKKLWYLFSPNGMVAGDFIYAGHPPDVRIFRLEGDLLDVGISCHYFPYPISGIKGKLKVYNGDIDLTDVVSKQSGGTIEMNGHITDANTPEPKYDFRVNAKNIGIDNKLISAFPADQRKFFNNFEIMAKGDADVYVHSTDNNQAPIDYMAKLKIRGDYIKSVKLSEPLKNIIIDTNLTPKALVVKKFSADYNSSPIDAYGTIWIGTEKEPMGYCVNLNAQRLTPDPNTIKTLVGESSGRLLKDFQFDGDVNVAAVVGKNSRIKCPDYEIAIQCLKDSAYLRKFDLPLDDISGRIIVRPEDIELAELSAMPVVDDMNKPGKITLNGKLQMAGGQVNWAMVKLKASDLTFDERYTTLLGSAQSYYSKLTPRGKFDLNLDRINFDKYPNGKQFVKVNGDAIFKNCSIGDSNLFSNIYALLNIDTLYDVNEGMKECKLDLNVNRLSFKDRPFENLKLKIPYDINDPDIVIRDFVGDCLGGRIAGNAIFKSDRKGGFAEYNVDLAIVGVSSQQFVSPKSVNKSDGDLNGEFRVKGNLKNPDEAVGRIDIDARGLELGSKNLITKIRDAILEKIKKDYAFDNIKVNAVVKGKIVEISRMDLYGATASLRGKGTYEPSTDSLKIDFVAYTAAGKEKTGFVDSFASTIGSAFLKVYVTGSLEKPVIKVEPLPILQKPFELIGTKKKK